MVRDTPIKYGIDQVSLRSRDAKQDIRVNSFALDLRQPIGPRPSRSPTLHHSIASLAAGFVVGSRVDWTPRLDAIFAPPLALRTTGNQYRLVATADYRPSRSLSMAGSERHKFNYNCVSHTPTSKLDSASAEPKNDPAIGGTDSGKRATATAM